LDETAALAQWTAPAPHFLESFDDAQPLDGVITLTQPVIAPLFDTRSLRESLAAWTDDRQTDEAFREALFRRTIYPESGSSVPFEEFWVTTRHDGFCLLPAGPALFDARIDRALRSLPTPTAAAGEELELVVHASNSMLEGRHAHNAWLHELPDPVTKATWGNWVSLAPERAEALGFQEGDLVALRTSKEGQPVVLPVQIQPGQHPRIVAVPLGFGRTGTDRFARLGPQWLESDLTVADGATIGANAAPLMTRREGLLQHGGQVVTIERRKGHEPLATTQSHHTLTVPANLAPHGGEVRDAVREVSLAAFIAGDRTESTMHGDGLWKDDFANDLPHWEMIVDLDRCTGCSACVVSCQVENNVPVVGRDEVLRAREMHWIRIDRYYRGEGDFVRMAHQPMMCHHCDNAPCETVCPVLATVHSEEGLNQQAYNRCVGTRYCANNCPYKVRRFNWFDYPHEDALQNLSLNPDITVRTRGVMEKCSFCVQRIQAAKGKAKADGRRIRDGEIEPACAQA
ncbi:MAG: 4Fe-4S dicluster domain-containing protein, partial [Myxococcales bacterium]|nr:4Fe-4S dicluster domain-containing protein [Myxococcales bacterium]